MTKEWYLGRCIYEPRPHTRLQPTAFSKDGKWQLYDNWALVFPPEGRVFTTGQPGLKLDTFFAFDAIETEETKLDRFRVVSSTRAQEVLDYTKWDPEEARKVLVESGIPGRSGYKEEVIVALRDNLCARLTLVPDTDGNNSAAELLDLERLKTYDFDNSLFSGDKIEGRWYAVPDVTVGPERGTIDWSRDRDFMEALIRQLKRLATPDVGQLPFATTKAQVHAFLTTLDRQGLLPARQGDWRTANSRTWNLAFDLKSGLEKVDEIVAVLGSLSPIEEEIAKTFAARTTELEVEFERRIEAEVRERIEDAYASESARNRRMEDENGMLLESLRVLEQDVAGLSERKRKVLLELETRAADIALLMEDPKIASNLDLRPVFANVADVLRGEGYPITQVEGVPPRSRLERIDRSIPRLAWAELNRALVMSADFHGFSRHDIVALDLVARAGQLLLLPSDVAVELMECYSSVLSQGKFVSQSLDPSVLGYDDLWRSPSSDLPTPLSRAWTACTRDPSTATLVLIEGVERSPVDLWIPPFIRALSGSERPRNLLVFLAMGGNVLDPARSYPDLTKVAVPFAPSMSRGPTGRLMGRLIGTRQASNWLDFAERNSLATDEASEILKKAMSLEPGDRLEVAARLCEAGRGTGTEALDATISSIWFALGGGEPDGQTSAFSAGRDVINNFIN